MKMKRFITFVFAATTLAFAGVAQANQPTPVGTWQSIDDETGKPTAEIRIFDKGNGELVGVVEKGLRPPKEGDDPLCNLCTDDRKGKAKIGLDIIRGAVLTAGTDRWEGGTILDPDKGKIYKLRLTMMEGGTKLQVRGYIGVFFRNQTWHRIK
jgi:uncharacterized protein (DUF2147 family)